MFLFSFFNFFLIVLDSLLHYFPEFTRESAATKVNDRIGSHSRALKAHLKAKSSNSSSSLPANFPRVPSALHQVPSPMQSLTPETRDPGSISDQATISGTARLKSGDRLLTIQYSTTFKIISDDPILTASSTLTGLATSGEGLTSSSIDGA